MTDPVYPFVAVDVVLERAEDLGAMLFELGAMGVEERDDQTLAKGAGGGKVTLVASFPTREEADSAIQSLREEDADLAPRIEEVVGDGWRDAWKEHFKPFALTPLVTVVPPWVAYERAREGEMILELEPGRAFGTGLHATTALVAELLHDHRDKIEDKPMLDVGTGSGILALVALRYGAKSVLAIDNDPEVIDVVRENATRNSLADKIEARQATVDSITTTYPLVVANIETRVLRSIAEDLGRTVGPYGFLILSGILAAEHDEIVALYTKLGRKLRHVESRRRRGEGEGGASDDWVAIAFAAV